MFFRQIGKIARAVLPTNVSAARARLDRANALSEYGHFKDALNEATQARDEKYATPMERELAKGKIVSVLNAMKQQDEADIAEKPMSTPKPRR